MSNPEVEALCDQGQKALKERDHAAANDAFEDALAIDPDCIDAHEGLAKVSYLDGDLAGAITSYTKLTQLKPMDGRYYSNIGAIYNQLGEHQKAFDVLRKSIQRDRKNAVSFYNLVIAQRKLKQNSLAVSAYKEAIKINPEMLEAYQNLGNTYKEMGNTQMAIINFKKAIDLKPNFEKARTALGNTEILQHQKKNSFSPFGRLVDSNPPAMKSAPAECKPLNEGERWVERQHVKHLADEIETLAKAFAEYIRHHVEPIILDAERAVAQVGDSAFGIPEVAETFRATVNRWSSLRATLKRKVLELRAHEELMNTPKSGL